MHFGCMPPALHKLHQRSIGNMQARQALMQALIVMLLHLIVIQPSYQAQSGNCTAIWWREMFTPCNHATRVRTGASYFTSISAECASEQVDDRTSRALCAPMQFAVWSRMGASSICILAKHSRPYCSHYIVMHRSMQTCSCKT